MKKILLFISIAFFTGMADVKAQKRLDDFDYSTAIGVKFYPGAISLKHFVNSKNAVEGLGYFWNRGFRITGLYEIHSQITSVGGLKWYVGPGAHIAFYSNKYYKGATLFGVDGVIGLDYKFRDIPLNLSVDWQPSFEFGDGSDFVGSWGGLGIRYVL